MERRRQEEDYKERQFEELSGGPEGAASWNSQPVAVVRKGCLSSLTTQKKV